jgi:hypothetical protein
MLVMAKNRPGYWFACQRCGDTAGYHFDMPFCAIVGDSLVYLAQCQRCGQSEYRTDFHRPNLCCPACVGELAFASELSTAEDAEQWPLFCPYCSEIFQGGIRPTGKRGKKAVAKLWKVDRRLFDLRLALGRFGENPRYFDANYEQMLRHENRRRAHSRRAMEAIGDDYDAVRLAGSD